MIQHAVLLQINPEITDLEVQLTLEHVRQLKEKIPGIISIATGRNLDNKNGGYTYGIIVSLKDQDALKVYATHPEHIPVLQEIKAICQDIIRLDLETAE